MTISNNLVYFGIGREKYDKSFAPYFNSINSEYLMNNGKYSFIIKTKCNEIIYVVPSKLGLPNNTDKVNIILENANQLTKSNLENLAKGEVKN